MSQILNQMGGVNVIFFFGFVAYKKKYRHIMYMQKHSLLTVHSYSTHLLLGDATCSLLPCAALFNKIQVVARGNVRCQRLRTVNSVTQSDHSRMHVYSEPCTLFLTHLEFENTHKNAPWTQEKSHSHTILQQC